MRREPSEAPSRQEAPLWLGAILALAGVLYGASTLPNLELPGLEYDEAYDASIAGEMLQGKPLLGAQSSLWFAGREWPLMSTEIEGATGVYYTAAAFSLLGVSVEALRLAWLLVGVGTLVLLWVLARQWFDAWTAGVAAMLCATSPVFAWWSRGGGRWNALLLPLALAMALALRRGWETRSPTWLGIAALAFGLGLSTKILFVWLLAPILLTAWLRRGDPRLRGGARDFSGRALAGIGAAFLVGLLPLLLHNLTDAATLQFLRANLFETQLYGHRNLDLWTNVWTQAGEFVRIMAGDTQILAPRKPSLVAAAALFLAIGTTTLRCVRGTFESNDSSGVTGRLFLLLTLFTVVPLSAISTSHIGATYLFFIVPFAWLLVAVSLRDGLEWLSPRLGGSGARFVVAATVVSLVLVHCLTNLRLQFALADNGGHGHWSDAIYTVAREVEQRYAGRPIVAMDWGFARNVEVLTEGRVRPIEAYEMRPRPSPGFAGKCTELLAEPSNVYLFHVPRHTAFRGVWEVFARAAEQSGRTLRLESTVHERDGAPLALIYTADPG